MVKGYNAQEADRYFTEPPEEPICEISGLDNCYQCPHTDCINWEEANA